MLLYIVVDAVTFFFSLPFASFQSRKKTCTRTCSFFCFLFFFVYALRRRSFIECTMGVFLSCANRWLLASLLRFPVVVCVECALFLFVVVVATAFACFVPATFLLLSFLSFLKSYFSLSFSSAVRLHVFFFSVVTTIIIFTFFFYFLILIIIIMLTRMVRHFAF